MSNEISVATHPGLIDRIGEKLERSTSNALQTVRPPFSLFTGAIFVLVSLYLPLAVNSCGMVSGPGKNILMGKSDAYLPFFELSDDGVGRSLYIVLLAWAGLTVFLVLFGFLISSVRRRRVVLRLLSGVSASISLILLGNYTLIYAARWPCYRVADPLI